MKVRRSRLFFLMMLLLAICCILLLAEKPIVAAVHTLKGAPEGTSWQTVGAGGGKLAAAAGWRDGKLVLRWFTTEGKGLSEQRILLPEEMEGGTVSQLLPTGDGSAYVGLYGPNGEQLYLYRIGPAGEAERLLAEECAGDCYQERIAHTMLSELSYEDGVLSFALCRDRELKLYLCRPDGGLEPAGKGECPTKKVRSILASENGSVLIGGTNLLRFRTGAASGGEGGRTEDSLVSGQSVTHLTQGRGGWYYLDAVRLDVCFLDSAFGAPQRMLSLSTAWEGKDRALNSAALTREESVLMLLDGSLLTLMDAGGMRALPGILDQTASKAWFTLIGYALIALAAAALLWLLLCALRQGYASLVLFRGSIFVSAALACFTILYFVYLLPMERASALEEQESLVLSIICGRYAGGGQTADFQQDVSRMLEGSGKVRNVRVVMSDEAEGTWRTSDQRLASSEEAFTPLLAERARSSAVLSAAGLPFGHAAEIRNSVFRWASWEAGNCVSIRGDLVKEKKGSPFFRPLLIAFAALACLALLILLTVGLDLRKITKRMERLAHGGVPEKLELPTGDELESMAAMVNSLGASLKEQEDARESVEHSYRRFVPEKVLALLGKQSIREVDKSSFAARRMAMMTVWFSFPEALYTDMNNSRLLFDSVNEVIERTASIVSRKGGTVFHFSYDGFDVVMEDGGDAVSTAVAIQQEVLSFNEQRAQERLPAVTLRIALDKGNVMLGIVGDTTRMEPTTISSSLSTVQELIDLGNRLKAGILCTEAIISEKQEYGNRYMGKCLVGNQPVRVYEVFDGDEFTVRRGKAASMEAFSQGVYDLYGGDAAAAKHRFLQLAHDYPHDGGVRYYLYLADRMEHDPSLSCVLNARGAGEGEM
ncbi:MAG: adenylate/guanylate cyclase domain-containing protein [Oscillospiraceae bacterium]|nr:adenylate/guanylate cyclase domain-containing protein [Oscillospiraceae bacterium]